MTQSQTPAEELLGFNNPQYDLAAKNVLSERSVAAYILKGTVPEFKNVSLKDIAEKCIEGDIQVSKVPVTPGNSAARTTARLKRYTQSGFAWNRLQRGASSTTIA